MGAGGPEIRNHETMHFFASWPPPVGGRERECQHSSAVGGGAHDGATSALSALRGVRNGLANIATGSGMGIGVGMGRGRGRGSGAGTGGSGGTKGRPRGLPICAEEGPGFFF